MDYYFADKRVANVEQVERVGRVEQESSNGEEVGFEREAIKVQEQDQPQQLQGYEKGREPEQVQVQGPRQTQEQQYEEKLENMCKLESESEGKSESDAFISGDMYGLKEEQDEGQPQPRQGEWRYDQPQQLQGHEQEQVQGPRQAQEQQYEEKLENMCKLESESEGKSESDAFISGDMYGLKEEQDEGQPQPRQGEWRYDQPQQLQGHEQEQEQPQQLQGYEKGREPEQQYEEQQEREQKHMQEGGRQDLYDELQQREWRQEQEKRYEKGYEQEHEQEQRLCKGIAWHKVWRGKWSEEKGVLVDQDQGQEGILDVLLNASILQNSKNRDLLFFSYSSSFIFCGWHKFLIVVIFFILLYSGIYKSTYFYFGLIAYANLIYLSLIFYKSFIVLKAFLLYWKRSGADKGMNFSYRAMLSMDLPLYSVLLPIYKEAAVIESLVYHIKSLYYPKNRMQVLFVVEENDFSTIDKLSQIILPSNFDIVLVPHSLPKTKAKACNYALSYVKGEYLVIYDAEDRPEPDQLLKSLNCFLYSKKKNLVCVQARLNYYNCTENWITQMFSIEYSILFDYTLHFVSNYLLPMPLGGSSNHFAISTLREINGWDSYNVTEDAELGIRFAMQKLDTQMIQSYTYEEAPLSFSSWLQQRRRWIKGHLLTYIIYMRNPMKTGKKLGLQGFFFFNYILGITIFAFLISPIIFMLSFLDYFTISMAYASVAQYISVITLFLGILSLHFQAFVTIFQKSIKNINRVSIVHKLWMVLSFPLYMLLHIVASYCAVWDLVIKPHYWYKTKHGVSKISG